MKKVRIALWNELEDRRPTGALVGNTDLVVVRYGDDVSVMYGRCLHRGALLADGHVDGKNLICGVHGWDYRVDIRVPTVEDFRAGENLQVIELNGVTSEATHIYDPNYSVLQAYRTLFRQWRILFEISAEQRAAGVKPAGLWAVGRALFRRLEEPVATT